MKIMSQSTAHRLSNGPNNMRMYAEESQLAPAKVNAANPQDGSSSKETEIQEEHTIALTRSYALMPGYGCHRDDGEFNPDIRFWMEVS